MKTIQPRTRQLILVAAIFSISFTVISQQPIPAKWQPGMTLTMSYGGGMRYYSYKMQISDTGSFFIENVEGAVTHYQLILTPKDLDSLLAFLRKHRFDKIKNERKVPMHDKGTESIALSWVDHYIVTGESYMELIAERYEEDYNAICGYLHSLRESKKKQVKAIPGHEPPQ